MNKPVNVPDIQKGGPYSHAIVSGNLIFLSGQTGNVPNRVLNFDQQFDNAMEKIKKILEAAGATIGGYCESIRLSCLQWRLEQDERSFWEILSDQSTC